MHEGRWSAAHVEERLESDATLGTVAAQVGLGATKLYLRPVACV